MSSANRLSLLGTLTVLTLSAVACGGSSSTPPATTYSLGGTVNRAICATGAACLVPVAGVTVKLTGASTATTTTDAAGAFSFTGLGDATFTVTPSLDGYAFTPLAPSVSMGAANKTQNFTAASAVANYSISGTVTYPGSKTGRVYLTVVPAGCSNCSGTAGTSLAGPGAYTIWGLTPGSYLVVARRDSLGMGFRNAADPTGSTAGTITITAASFTGADIALADPVAPSPGVLANPPNLIAGKGGMLIFWDIDRDSFGTEKATSYDISWGTDVAASNLATMSGVPALDDGSYLQTGLPDATTYYYKVRSNVGVAHGGWSPIASATTGAAAGGYTVSGTVAFTGTATGPLFVAVGDPNSGNMQVAAYPTPTSSPASFSVTGVPAGGASVYAILDQNHDGVIDEGDLKNVNDQAAPVVDVTGNTTGVAVTLSSAKGIASTTTEHARSAGGADGYSLLNDVADGVKRAVKVTLLSGKNLPVPADLPKERGYFLWTNIGATVPGIGDTYRFEVLYSDGSTETLSSPVNAVLNSFAQGLTETTSGIGSVAQPVFSWSAPATPPPGTWGYAVALWGPGANWNYPRDARMVPNTTTAVQYNADGNASPPSLVSGTYTWNVTVLDAAGNRARQDKDYVVP